MAHRCQGGRRLSIVAASLLSVLAGTSSAQANVVVVDPSFGPGTDYTLLGPALVAARDGDTILIKKGVFTYPLYVSGKSLTIIADAGATVNVPQIWVENLASTQCVTIRGINTAGLASQASCQLNDNAGPVILEDCEINPLGIATFPTGGLTVSNCTSVALVRCSVAAPLGKPPLAVTAAMKGASVHMWSCTVDGAAGADSATIGGAGGTAVELSGGFLFASGCTFVGGAGGDGTTAGPPCAAGGNGGAGLRLSGVSPTAYLHATKTAGGRGGISADPTSCRDGVAGMASDVLTGSVQSLPGTPSTFETSSPMREGEKLTETYVSAPGAAAYLLLSVTHGQGIFSLGLRGSLLAGPVPLMVVPRGIVPATGTLKAGTIVPELGAGVESVVLYEQAALLDFTAGAASLGPITVCTLLDGSL